jgi:uncharacterized protein YkwD
MAALVAALALAGPAQAKPASTAPVRGDEACPTASELVADLSSGELRRTVRCLIVAERSARGLGKLARPEPLETAAKRHVKTMIETDCLAHKCPGEPDLEKRLRKAGYLTGATSYQFAESTGCGTTAASMVTSWMATPFDRTNILDPDFEDIGVWVSPDSSDELCGDGYGTFAVVLGTREP